MAGSGDRSPARSPSPTKGGGDKAKGKSGDTSSSEKVIVERVVKEASASVVYPMLTHTNYNDWSLVMQVCLEAQGLWEAIDVGTTDRRENRLALASLIRAVPAEMHFALAVKKSAKEAWEAIKTMRMGVAWIQVAQAIRDDHLQGGRGCRRFHFVNFQPCH